jgi:hypothetical protein
VFSLKIFWGGHSGFIWRGELDFILNGKSPQISENIFGKAESVDCSFLVQFLNQFALLLTTNDF